MNDRLYRSLDDRMLAGVCGGLAERFAIDPSIVRVGYALLAVVSGIVPLLIVYVLLAIVLPEGPPTFTGSMPISPAPGTPADEAWRTVQAAERAAWREARRARRASADPSGGALVIGAILVLVGLVFLVRPYVRIDWDIVWPIAVIGLGALVVVGGLTRQRPR